MSKGFYALTLGTLLSIPLGAQDYYSWAVLATWNDFSNKANEWSEQHRVHTISSQDYRLFKEMSEKWNKFRTAAKQAGYKDN